MIRSAMVSLRSMYTEELILYKRHHRNEVNRLLHVVLVPIEWTSWLMMLSIVRLQWMVAVIIAVYYLTLSRSMSKYAACGQLISAALSSYLCNCMQSSISNVILLAAFIQITSWIIQVLIGHYIFEQNSPSMSTRLTLNSVVLSLLLAWDETTVSE